MACTQGSRGGDLGLPQPGRRVSIAPTAAYLFGLTTVWLHLVTALRLPTRGWGNAGKLPFTNDR
jgi:hypothetical protein